MERNVVKAFAEISNPETGVFTEKMRDMILIAYGGHQRPLMRS